MLEQARGSRRAAAGPRPFRSCADAARPRAAPRAQLLFASRARAEGVVLFERGLYVEAEAVFSDGLEKMELVNPFGFPTPAGSALLLCNRALARAAQSRFRDALQDIDAALEMAPHDAGFAERRVVIVRALNRAQAFGAEGYRTTRALGKDEDSICNRML